MASGSGTPARTPRRSGYSHLSGSVPPLDRERERLADAIAEMQARDAARAAAASRHLDELIRDRAKRSAGR